jgi:hypothetical protein
MPLNDSTANESPTVLKKVKRNLEDLYDALVSDGQFVKYRKICLETKMEVLSLHDDDKKN